MINAVLLVFSLIISLPICHLLRLSTPLRMSMQNNELDRLDISRRKMEHIICSNPSEFDATLSKALEVDKPCFVLFTGNQMYYSESFIFAYFFMLQGQRIKKRVSLGVQTVWRQSQLLAINLVHWM
jgi:hypothetical protein